MKTRVLSLLVAVALLVSLLPNLVIDAEAADVIINEENFPDARFREGVRVFDVNNDGILSTAERRTISIGVDGWGVTSLKGIEYFLYLQTLNCDHNQLTELDVSKNTRLWHLSCEGNWLTSLDVSNNTLLLNLDCGTNRLTSLDVSKNTKLQGLTCYQNQLTTLDVSKNPSITLLSCSENQLTRLDTSGNPELQQLACHHNLLTELNVSGNPRLRTLDCTYNQLKTIDLSGNGSLKGLSCYGNPIQFLNVRENQFLVKALRDGIKREDITEFNRYELLQEIPSGFYVMEYDLNTKTIPAGNSEPPCEHQWDDGVYTSAPECESWGQRVVTCTNCGEYYSEFIAPLGHDWSDWTTLQEQTCTTASLQRRTCSRCGKTEEETEPALGHIWEVTEILTEREEGFHSSTALYTCARCAETKEARLCAGEIFEDMPKENNFAHDPIDWAFFHEITSGTTATTFSPKSSCTRGQALTFLWRACGCPEPETTENPFTDVKPKNYFYKAVLWAVENGITTGTGDNTFSPNSICTRGHIVTFLWRAAGSPEPESSENPFADVSRKAFYAKAVLWAVEKGITNGTSAAAFTPGNSCTRAQVVTFLYRYSQLPPPEPDPEPTPEPTPGPAPELTPTPEPTSDPDPSPDPAPGP